MVVEGVAQAASEDPLGAALGIVQPTLEYAGTIAFAVSGALLAARKRMDLVGVLVLACLVAVGGGTMRDVLVEQARSKAALRRGGDWKRAELDGIEPTLATPAEDLLALDDALTRLEAEDARKAEVVRLRFFAGLGEDEIAEALGVSKRTVSRAWSEARARLAVLVKPPEA